MFKIIFLVLIATSCGNNQNDTRKDQENKKQKELERQREEEERLKRLEEEKLKLEVLNNLKELIINNTEDLEENLKTFKALLKDEYLNYIYSSKDEKIDGKTMLMIAIEAEKIEFVELLLAQDSLDVNMKSREGKRALEYAIKIKNLALIRELLKRKEIFIDGTYFGTYKITYYGGEELYNLIFDSYDKNKTLSEDLYKLFLSDNIDESNIRTLIQNGANLNYHLNLSSEKPILILYKKILEDKEKIKLLLKYGLEKVNLIKGLVYLDYSKFDITLDYFKFLVEEAKLDFNFEVEKYVKESSDWKIPETEYHVNLIGEMYQNISTKKEILKYILNSPYIDINKTFISGIPYYKNNGHIVIKAIEKFEYDLVSELIDNPKLNINYVFENYLKTSDDYRSFLFTKVLYKNGLNQDQALTLLEKLFKKGLSESNVKVQNTFLKEIKNGENRLEKARNLVKKYYPNIKF